MPVADLKTAQVIAHASSLVVEETAAEFDRLASVAIDRGDVDEARRLVRISELLSREAERLRGI